MLGKSFMYIKNKRGPRTDPCGTPQVMFSSEKSLDFEPLRSLVKDKLDIILLSETKIDESFPSSQFAIGYTKPFRRDSDIHGEGLLNLC